VTEIDASTHGGRNLIVCLDGTNNEIAKPNSNVYRLYRAIEAKNQLAFYQPGVGTLINERALYKTAKLPAWLADSAGGASLRESFVNGYGFLSTHWTPEDRIFMFGFSRGAYAVRAIAGAIKVFGLVRPEQSNLIPYIWQEYIDAALRVGKKPEPVFEYGNRFKRDFSIRTSLRIRFLGLWDTVSSLGKVSAFKSLPHTRENDLVEVIRHAVALDERRGLFQPNLFETDTAGSDVQQIWFPGFHSDVGGGQPLKESGIGSVTFEWIVGEARAAGLRFNDKLLVDFRKACPPDPSAPLHDSMDAMYRMLEFLPIRKFDMGVKGLAWHAPHLFRPRRIPEGDAVHLSVGHRMKVMPSYRPRNL